MAKKSDNASKTTDYSAMSKSDLESTLQTTQQDLLESRRSHAAGELVNPRVLRSYRKTIARIKTALAAKEEN